MELDKRIKEGKRPLTAFDVMESKFIGTDCYFSDKASDFGDLSNCQVGTLVSRDGMTGVFNATKNNSYAYFDYCLPCEWVKEEPAPKHIDFEVAKKDKNFERCDLYGEELLFDTKNNIFYTSDGNVHAYLTTMAQHRYNEEQTKDVIIEKKYREYKNLDEFFDVTGLEIGDLIHLKFPGNNVAQLLIVGGCDDCLFIGIHKYTFAQLFAMVEISISGDWQPFGVMEE